MTRPNQEPHAAHRNRNEERHGEQRPGPSERRQPPPPLTPHYEPPRQTGTAEWPYQPPAGLHRLTRGCYPKSPTSTAIEAHRPHGPDAPGSNPAQMTPPQPSPDQRAISPQSTALPRLPGSHRPPR